MTAPQAGSTLSPQELRALRLLATSDSRKEVAVAMGISLNTAQTHIRSAYNRLGAFSAIEAFRVIGWLRVPPEDELPTLNLRILLLQARDDIDAMLAKLTATT